MEFDLQRFTEDVETSAEPETPAGSSPEELEPIPEELGGIPEDIARETMEEWGQTKARAESNPEPPSLAESQQSVSREEYEQLKAQLAEFKKQQQPQVQQQPQQPQQPQQLPQPQYQPPQFKITPENSVKLAEAIKAEALALTGFSQGDVDSLDYADDDDPRLAQWSQAKSIATNRVYTALRQMLDEQARTRQQFLIDHAEANQSYGELVKKAVANADHDKVQAFATGELFNRLEPIDRRALAGAYLRVDRQTASPAELLAVKLYYKLAQYEYRNANKLTPAPAQQRTQKASQLPRTDMLRGNSGTGEVSAANLEHMLDTMPFDKIPEAYRNKLLGY